MVYNLASRNTLLINHISLSSWPKRSVGDKTWDGKMIFFRRYSFFWDRPPFTIDLRATIRLRHAWEHWVISGNSGNDARPS